MILKEFYLCGVNTTGSLGVSERLVLNYLIDCHYEFNGSFAVALSTIVFDLSISTSTVKTTIKSLKEKELIEVRQSEYRTNYKPYNEYTVNFDKVNKVIEDWKEEKRKKTENKRKKAFDYGKI